MIEITDKKICSVDQKCMSCKNHFKLTTKISNFIMDGEIEMHVCGFYECNLKDAQEFLHNGNCKGFDPRKVK